MIVLESLLGCVPPSIFCFVLLPRLMKRISLVRIHTSSSYVDMLKKKKKNRPNWKHYTEPIRCALFSFLAIDVTINQKFGGQTKFQCSNQLTLN
jgi:hypothetical protein